MKRIVLVVLILSMVMAYTACANDDYEFYGTIDSIDGTTALVNITKGEILDSGDKVYIEITDQDFKVGDEIVVTYDGNVMESYPLQINQNDIKLI